MKSLQPYGLLEGCTDCSKIKRSRKLMKLLKEKAPAVHKEVKKWTKRRERRAGNNLGTEC